MEVIDYNGPGRWSRAELVARYIKGAVDRGIVPRDLSPMETRTQGRRWVYPVMRRVVEGIEAGDPVCVEIGVEFIEENAKFPFGKALKSHTARALRRAASLLSFDQKRRIRRRVFGLLRAGHIPHEYREYAKLVRRIGFEAGEIPEVAASNPYAVQFRGYFEMASRADR